MRRTFEQSTAKPNRSNDMDGRLSEVAKRLSRLSKPFYVEIKVT